MVPQAVDLDYLRGKAAAYRRDARAVAAPHLAAHLLELASRYEMRAFELEQRAQPPAGHGRG